MDVGISEGHNADSPTHTRHIQLCSGRGVQNNQGSHRLETQSLSFQQDQQDLWTPRNRSVCILTDPPTATILQLETRPTGGGNRRLSAELGSPEGVRQPSPWCLMGRVLSQVMEQRAQVVLVAPVWKGQPWYPVLLGMLWEFPRQISPFPDLIQNPAELTTQLAMWPISGRSSMTVAFQRKLQGCCWPPGGPSQTNLMTRTSESGLAGVWNEVPIPFQDL